jgi:hypothetical protein
MIGEVLIGHTVLGEIMFGVSRHDDFRASVAQSSSDVATEKTSTASHHHSAVAPVVGLRAWLSHVSTSVFGH